MTVRAGEEFGLARAVSDIDALLARPVPADGPTAGEGDPLTGEWSLSRGEGFLIAPLWESDDLVGVYEEEWEAADRAAHGHLADVARRLDDRWGGHYRVPMHVPLLRKQRGEPMPPLFDALGAQACFGDLTVWGPVTEGPDGAPRWVAVSLNQTDGDAPMVIVAVVTDHPITPLPDEL